MTKLQIVYKLIDPKTPMQMEYAQELANRLSKKYVESVYRTYQATGTFCTHDIEEACPYCDHINLITDGRISMVTICEGCGRKILLCGYCAGDDCDNCPYEKELNQ